jgi:parallel beta-helix repeat protein
MIRALLTLIVGVGLAVGALYLSQELGLSRPAAGPKLVFAPGVDLASELEKLGPNAKPQIIIPLGENLQERTTEALISIPEGGSITFEEGKYEFSSGLQVRVPGVTVRGQGQEKTILNFEKQLSGTGGEGLLVKADRFTCEDLTLEETKGDAVKVEGSNGVVFRRVSTLWHNEGNPKNGAYGLYPVNCKNVLIESCVAEGASDAGIYVGQSENIIVRNCRAEKNVAGIEIENSKNADVYQNIATNNAGGLLIFDLPGLPSGNGGNHRVYDNKVYKNNHANFAPEGNIVATVPAGTGLMVMATDNVEIFNNTIEDNKTSNTSVISFIFTGRKIEDKNYDPIPEGIYIHDNTFVGGGEAPSGTIKLLAGIIGTPYPDIIYDGIVNPAQVADGKPKDGKGIYVEKNKDGDFVNLRFDLIASPTDLLDPAKAKEHAAKLERDLSAVAGKIATRQEVKLDGIDLLVK